MKVVVGLGNPGKRYLDTRHNVGFVVVDRLAQGPDVGPFASRFDAEIAEWRRDGDKVLLVKPQTFMNLSGQAVRRIVDFYQVPPGDLLVVCDDVNLPLGQLRIRPRGSHGGHRGLQDIQRHLGTTEYPRLRIGVGQPEGGDLAEYVLDRFRPVERPVIEEAMGRAAQAVEVWLHRGIEAAMNEFNARSSAGKKSDPAKE
ncbi:MAG: aminoacyl-tRNA hydrolase [Gemmatales bacterium]|nr:aminoacyl-tRNA hydrolase [Gemmatales bacterium]MDW8386334.1 aminoacyl-tRNA hydrolase [Gemmatales bacterium]